MRVWRLIAQALAAHGRCAMVSIHATKGSVPREKGARLVLTPQGFHGTIGGGALEWQALAEAQRLMHGGSGFTLKSYTLGPDMGQCCGGRVDVLIESFDASMLPMARDFSAREAQGRFVIKDRIPSLGNAEYFGEDHRTLLLFGAGHVGQALMLALAPLPFAVRWVDARPDIFPKAVPANVTLHAPADPLSMFDDVPDGSFAFVMSHSHALDLLLVDAALRHGAIAHVGLIGSTTKRARFAKRLAEAGVARERIAGLICPIGIAGIPSKRPAMIAASVVAQILQLDAAMLSQGADIPQTLRVAP